jgi:hypothetical protein
MKTTIALFTIVSFMLTGCGKNADQKKVEADLNAEVMKIHEKQMKDMQEIRDLMAGIDIELMSYDKLVHDHPTQMAGQSPDDLVDAKKMLLSAKSAMESWMSGYTMYNAAMKHEEAMAKLARDKDDLTKVQASIDAAKSAANTTLAAHRKLADQIAAATPASARQGKK